MKRICAKNDYELYFDEREGYSILNTKTKATYSLLEGKSFGAKTTSDIIFIMKDAEFDASDDMISSEEFVNYFFGASNYKDDLYELLCDAVSYIEDHQQSMTNKIELVNY